MPLIAPPPPNSTVDYAEVRSVAYYAVGVASEGGDVAYRLSLAGKTMKIKDGEVMIQPVGNSGYSIGTLQTDLGQHPDVARDLVEAFQDWAAKSKPDWLMSDRQQQALIADLARDGNHIRDASFTEHARQYGGAKHIPAKLYPAAGHDIDQTAKSRLDAYLGTPAGTTFIHGRDLRQVEILVQQVSLRLGDTELYRQAKPNDQTRLLAETMKAYNQNETKGARLIRDIELGKIASGDGVAARIASFPSYMQTGAAAALRGADALNALRQAPPATGIGQAWAAVKADPLVNPTQLAGNARQPSLPQQYALIKTTFVEPLTGKAFVTAASDGTAYSHGGTGARARGFYAQGGDLVQWDRDGHGRAYLGGHWRDVSRADLTVQRQRGGERDVLERHDGKVETILKVIPGGKGKPAGVSAILDQAQSVARGREQVERVELDKRLGPGERLAAAERVTTAMTAGVAQTMAQWRPIYEATIRPEVERIRAEATRGMADAVVQRDSAATEAERLSQLKPGAVSWRDRVAGIFDGGARMQARVDAIDAQIAQALARRDNAIRAVGEHRAVLGDKADGQGPISRLERAALDRIANRERQTGATGFGLSAKSLSEAREAIASMAADTRTASIAVERQKEQQAERQASNDGQHDRRFGR